jgi:hypothetical protein
MRPSLGPSPPPKRCGLSPLRHLPAPELPPLRVLPPRAHPEPGAAQKKKQQHKEGGVKSKKEGPEGVRKGRFFLPPPFTLTRATWRTSQATVTSVSSSDRHVNATCEQASSVPLITGPQSVDKEGIQGKPGIPNSRSPETMTSKDPGAGGTSPATTSRGEL